MTTTERRYAWPGTTRADVAMT